MIGIVVYTGKEARIQMNLEKPKVKKGYLDRIIGYKIIGIALIQIILCLILVIVNQTKDNDRFLDQIDRDSNDDDWDVVVIQQFILLAKFIPISLFVFIEFFRFFKGSFINISDQLASTFYTNGEPNKIYSQTNSYSLTEELGRVKYLLTDKTGTLTLNKLSLISIFAADHLFGGRF